MDTDTLRETTRSRFSEILKAVPDDRVLEDVVLGHSTEQGATVEIFSGGQLIAKAVHKAPGPWQKVVVTYYEL